MPHDLEGLRAKLAEIDARAAAVEAEAKPHRDAFAAKDKPFRDREQAIDEERETLLEDNSASVVGHCEGCSTLILEGDRYSNCSDGPILCLECSPTWEEAAAHMRSYTCGDPDDERERTEAIANAEAMIAAGKGDEKVC